MTIKPETLKNYRFTVLKMDGALSRDQILTLIDAHLEALAEIERLTAKVTTLEQDWCSYDCSRCHDDDDPHDDCPGCGTDRG